ncbi:MAG: GNAT family N-acetyltransferase [Gaiellales bacterium]
MRIRATEERDHAAIAAIVCAVAATGETYALPRDLSPAAALEAWLDPAATVLAAVDDDETVLGTAKYLPVRPAGGAHVATASFMVAPDASGRGIGRALGEEVLRRAREAGYAAMQFNAVVETNTAAIALWESLGFRVMTTIPAAFEHPTAGRVGLHVMHREL